MGKAARECGIERREKAEGEWQQSLVENGRRVDLLLGCWEDEGLLLRSGEKQARPGVLLGSEWGGGGVVWRKEPRAGGAVQAKYP
jgi:hypothetical protein